MNLSQELCISCPFGLYLVGSTSSLKPIILRAVPASQLVLWNPRVPCVPMRCSHPSSVSRIPSACLWLYHITLCCLFVCFPHQGHSSCPIQLWVPKPRPRQTGKHPIRFPSFYFQACANDNGPTDPGGIILKSASWDTLPTWHHIIQSDSNQNHPEKTEHTKPRWDRDAAWPSSRSRRCQALSRCPGRRWWVAAVWERKSWGKEVTPSWTRGLRLALIPSLLKIKFSFHLSLEGFQVSEAAFCCYSYRSGSAFLHPVYALVRSKLIPDSPVQRSQNCSLLIYEANWRIQGSFCRLPRGAASTPRKTSLGAQRCPHGEMATHMNRVRTGEQDQPGGQQWPVRKMPFLSDIHIIFCKLNAYTDNSLNKPIFHSYQVNCWVKITLSSELIVFIWTGVFPT